MPASRPDSVLGLEKVSRPQWHLRGMRKAPVTVCPAHPHCPKGEARRGPDSAPPTAGRG